MNFVASELILRKVAGELPGAHGHGVEGAPRGRGGVVAREEDEDGGGHRDGGEDAGGLCVGRQQREARGLGIALAEGLRQTASRTHTQKARC